MKKIILYVLMLFCLLPTQVLAKEIPVFNANGQKLPLTPSAYTENDVTMLPLRAVAEYLGAKVNWQSNGTIIVSKDNCQIALPEELPECFWSCIEKDDNGYTWFVTKVSNPRAYINLQALRDNEPEMYERWTQRSNIFNWFNSQEEEY